jgi:hypothetical protein
MVDWFHWVIFAFHLSAALVITAGVLLRCDPDVWVSRMSVDTYSVQANSSGLWWYSRGDDLVRQCSLRNSTGSVACFQADLPLYEKMPGHLGWHLFVLLGHFEWISVSFAFYYVDYAWKGYSWWVSCAIVTVGSCFALVPSLSSDHVFSNEIFLVVFNWFVSLTVFFNYRSVHKGVQLAPRAASDTLAPFRLSGNGNLVPYKLLDVQLPALRFCEYCITASELYVAVLCVFVQDPPAFMSLGGYTLILLTNLYGLLLHYSLVSDNLQGYLSLPASRAALPPQEIMERERPFPVGVLGESMRSGVVAGRRTLRVPLTMLGATPMPLGDAFRTMMQRRVWGSYIASNTSTLLNSWLAYLVAVALIFYQQTFLFSSEPPFFVVFAGWSLLFSYSSFGIWMTIVFWYPDLVAKICCFARDKELYSVAVYGLDILSLASKLSIVGSLSYGFVFREEGRC